MSSRSGHFEALTSPDVLAPSAVDHPARGRTQKLCELPIAIPVIRANQFGDVFKEGFFIVLPQRVASCAVSHYLYTAYLTS